MASWDTALFKFINLGLANRFCDWLMPWVSTLVPLVPLLLAAAWLVAKGGRRGLWVVLGCALLFVFTDWITTQLWRPLLGRLRPYAALEGIRYSFGDLWRISDLASMAKAAHSYGLPSAHAANAMGPAVFLGFFYPRLGRWLVAAALLVGFSRVYVGAHFPGDVLAGYLWGGLCGWLLALVMKRLPALRRPETAPLSAPRQD